MDYAKECNDCLQLLNKVWMARKESLGATQSWQDDAVMVSLQISLNKIYQMKQRFEIQRELENERGSR
jgi:hypothetical protein